MLKKPGFAISILNFYIIAFLIVLQMNISDGLEKAMLLGASFMVMWMFYTVITGYGDRIAKKKVWHKH